MPKSIFVILVIAYVAAASMVSFVATGNRTIVVNGITLPANVFAGVFSSLANIVVIFLSGFYGKLGYITSIVLLLLNFVGYFQNTFIRRNYASLPGIVGNFLTLTAISIIYFYGAKVNDYQTRLYDQALIDILTGLPNRFAASELLSGIIKKKEPSAIVLINLNNFKGFNEAMGFDIGNRALKDLADRWNAIANSRETGTEDFVGRTSGDEFILIIRGFKTDKDIVSTIKKYDEALTEQMNIDGYECYLSANYGYCLFPDDSNDRDSLISYAEAALKETKHNRNESQILRFDIGMLKGDRSIEVVNMIKSALLNDKIYYSLQPQFSFEHKLRGFEALARMKDDEGRVISPNEFIPIAEDGGLIDAVDLTVLKASAIFMGEALKKFEADIILSVNVSVRHLMKSDFLDEVKEILALSNLPPQNLEIEITESIIIDSFEKALVTLGQLKELGVKIAIDDFGTGYSSLSYLSNIPANLLKIDKSFIDKMNEGESYKQYVEAIISMGHILGLEVISEGVEEEEQLEILRWVGCDYIQGFLWGRPISPKDSEDIIRRYM
ncbi:MAG: bifunctional diguanylate cyclase/phosphodiesterase [Butyrivibrio sp.]|nr:bifunctional diguanylate cyclase/phosphodiesterase [Butyrivibrio sp.]